MRRIHYRYRHSILLLPFRFGDSLSSPRTSLLRLKKLRSLSPDCIRFLFRFCGWIAEDDSTTVFGRVCKTRFFCLWYQKKYNYYNCRRWGEWGCTIPVRGWSGVDLWYVRKLAYGQTIKQVHSRPCRPIYHSAHIRYNLYNFLRDSIEVFCVFLITSHKHPSSAAITALSRCARHRTPRIRATRCTSASWSCRLWHPSAR